MFIIFILKYNNFDDNILIKYCWLTLWDDFFAVKHYYNVYIKYDDLLNNYNFSSNDKLLIEQKLSDLSFILTIKIYITSQKMVFTFFLIYFVSGFVNDI